ncbi:hypothetical protein [Azohydromonas aeria]|uniref:hypothetical protein n=1 Tax=Azohydromonas aeria TaxID=2590212 RepID=UPI0012FAE260|nr:hypothetical protein [Azohydromonas aeria]
MDAASVEPRAGRRWLLVLQALFAFFNGARVLTYLPQIWAIESSGQSGQHSLLTWLTWLGANVTMALWLYEQNGRRVDPAAALSIANAAMCLLTVLVILRYRL